MASILRKGLLLLLVGLFVSCFMAWRDEYRRANALDRTNATLDAKVQVLQKQLEAVPKTSGKSQQEEAVQLQSSPAHIQILYEKAKLDGRAISIPATPGVTSTGIYVPALQFKNDGGRITGTVSARLYFSKPVYGLPYWILTESDEPGFPSEFYAAGDHPVTINPTEVFNWATFQGQLLQPYTEPIAVKLKVFYGSAEPSIANFIIRKEK
jgi:hypothetical protein